ncbi:hypothetical protein FQU75_06880 [Paenibacillus polymyxa]|nr:hypothetical protein FQU75_06880 [Paenibacillus polymyxa]
MKLASEKQQVLPRASITFVGFLIVHFPFVSYVFYLQLDQFKFIIYLCNEFLGQEEGGKVAEFQTL